MSPSLQVSSLRLSFRPSLRTFYSFMLFQYENISRELLSIDQVIPDYRAEIVGGTGPDIGAAVIRVAITGSGYHTIALSLSLAGSRAWRLSRLSPVLGILTPISQSSRPLSHHRTGIPSSDQRHVRLMTHGAIVHWQSNASVMLQIISLYNICTFIETKCD